MSLPVRSVTPEFYVAGQLAPTDMAAAAAMGFKTVVNNRPDGEGGSEQPTAISMQAAAQAAGLHYVFLPVVAGLITPEQAVAMKQTLDAAPQPVLAFCRSGARSTQLFMLAHQTAG
jgi:uncharacterized protein (TIGR01244 family)